MALLYIFLTIVVGNKLLFFDCGRIIYLLYRVSQKSRTTQVFHFPRAIISYTCAVKKFIDQLSQT